MLNSMTGDRARPRLSPKVCLRADRLTGRELLLYPETGLELNRTATEIARLCTGERTVDDIARQLAHRYTHVSLVDITQEVREFLKTLADRGLLQTDRGKTRPIHRTPAGCSKRPSSKAAASKEARRTLRYVEHLSDARTPLADFFSTLLGFT